MSGNTVEIRCLGDFEVQGLAVDVQGVKQIALLAYLASNLGAPCPRETLISIFWGDRFNDQARQSLRQALSALRRAFRDSPDALEIDREMVRLNPKRVSVDLKQAETAVAAGDLRTASEIFRRGDYLSTLNPKESGIADWLALERARWRELARRTLLEHGETLLQNGHVTEAGEVSAWLLQQDPLDEVTARLAMRSKAASGAVFEAAKIYHRLCDDLQSELGVKPAAETTACFDRLQSGKPVLDTAKTGNTPKQDPVSDVPLIAIEPFD